MIKGTEVKGRLFITGAGIRFPEHLTLEILEVLDRAEVIFSNLPEERLVLLPKDLLSKTKSLWGMHIQGEKRIKNYSAISNYILSQCEVCSQVAWLTQGHPRVFDSVSTMLCEAAEDSGIECVVIPGVSCIDTLLVDVGYDPAAGMLVHEATSFVRRNIPAVPHLALVLLQPSSFMSDIAQYGLDKLPPDYELLERHLLRFYAPDHEALFVRSSMHAGYPHETECRSVSTLSAADFRIVAGSTLFIPPVDSARPGTD